MNHAISTWPRARRTGALALLAVLAAAGCATKKDIRLLRDEVIALQARQDSAMLHMERNYRLLFDTLRTAQMAQLDQAGQTSHRFRQLEESLDRMQRMITDLQVLVTDLRAQMEQQLAAQRAPASFGPAPMSPPPAGNNQAANMFRVAQQGLEQGGTGAARTMLEDLLEQYPTDPIAPEAQYLLGITWERDGDYEQAIGELSKVWMSWPNAPAARRAMLQAGIIAQEKEGNEQMAREFYRNVQARWPNTPEAEEAARRAGGVT